MKTSRDRAYFETIYAKNLDPWCFLTSEYERQKYQITLEMLRGRMFQRGFEVGCSIGVLTEKLAPYCKSLLAIDIVPTVLKAATQRCRRFQHVSFENRQVPKEWPLEKSFDLIILSELLYFLKPEDVGKIADLACRDLVPGGIVLLVNYTKQIDEPCSGDQAAEIFISASNKILSVETQARHDKFRVDLLTSRETEHASRRPS